jgi:hypothetical protein
MNRIPLLLLVSAATVCAQAVNPDLLKVKRIYVAPLSGKAGADTLRDFIISSLNETKLFVLTDDPARADAVLKGSAEEHAYEDELDTLDSVNGKNGAGNGGGLLTRSGGLNVNLGASETESHHVRERKHEAYAAVRLCTKDGDVLWSTTQESPGAKFRGAGPDVAAKVARQLMLDMERARRPVPAAQPAQP